MIKLVLVLSALVVSSGCATSGMLKGDLSKLVRADVEAAHGIAKESNDAAGVACMEVLLKHIPTSAAVSTTPAGAVSAFMLVREARRKRSAGIPDDLHNACAPLVLDAEETILKLGLLALPGGGLAGRALGR